MNPAFIDVNVNLSRWPTRRLRDDQPSALVATLQSHGVVQAWAGSLDGLLHKDLAAVNQRLAEECRAAKDVSLLPVGSINPLQPDWPEDLERCIKVHRMHAVRVHPNYHGYTLDHPTFAELLKQAQGKGLMVMLPLQMEDERVMHPLLRVKPVDIDPLKKLLPALPDLRLVILNAGKGLAINKLAPLTRIGRVYLDIAMLDGLAVIEEVVKEVPLDRLLFGSHSPLFYFESAKLKLQEAELSQAASRAIAHDNASQLLTR